MNENILEDFATAIEEIDSTVINSMLSSRLVDANARLPRDGNPPALVYAGNRTVEPTIVKLLLNAGARIDDVDDNGWSACHIVAALDARVDMMRVLLAHRPNLALRCAHGRTALALACRNRQRENVPLLLSAGASLDDLIPEDLCSMAAIDMACLRLLMSRNVVVGDLRDDLGQTPLHCAVRSRRGDAAVMSMLINNCGVDLEARDLQCNTCTRMAVFWTRIDDLRCFLQAGADVNSAQDYEPLLHTSVNMLNLGDHTSKFACTMLLLAAGADVTVRDEQGRTACLLVSQSMHMPFVHAMVAAGADLDAADDDGKTPRQHVARHRQLVDAEQVEFMRREIAKTRLDFVRHRALQVCIGLQSCGLDALQTSEILVHACGPLSRFIAFHQWWKIATTVKHFKA
jgi:ankyrin repeat protein